ncbi:calmodulin [Plakobranchus ocellatus]|uniref:Calmodulin n=1 Tax=Plakobranchus ocellatus TaxID=259542 RepID=A0AAV4D022_9GAST|nr:calmodulin [Plakobranchus ocellatus]
MSSKAKKKLMEKNKKLMKKGKELGLTQKQFDDINATFCLFDADGNGKITRSELREVVKALGKAISERDLDAMLSSVDSDGSGGIEFDEFLPLIAREFGKKDDVERHVRETFRSFDANGDGVISAREFRQAVAKMGQNLTDAEVSEFMRSVDKDGDGVITYEGSDLENNVFSVCSGH